jgi:ornithine cyclodeaminase/alanine dehydrogenase-like protein (mu-crystallin family)
MTSVEEEIYGEYTPTWAEIKQFYKDKFGIPPARLRKCLFQSVVINEIADMAEFLEGECPEHLKSTMKLRNGMARVARCILFTRVGRALMDVIFTTIAYRAARARRGILPPKIKI